MTSSETLAPDPAFPGWITLGSLLLILLVTGVSLTGILIPEKIYPEHELALSFVPMDIVNLVMAVPLMLLSLLLVHRKRLIGSLCLPGILFYLLYVYMGYLIGLKVNILFVFYLLVVLLSMVGTALLFNRMYSHQIKSRLEGQAPVRTSGWIIAVIAVAILVFQLWSIIRSLSTQIVVDRITLAQWIDDLVIGTPAMVISGIHMIRRSPFGYLTATSVLLFISMLFIGLIPVMIAEGVLSGTPVKMADLLIIAVSSLICLVPLGLLVRGVLKAQNQQSER